MKSIFVLLFFILSFAEAHAEWKCSYKHILTLESSGDTKENAASTLLKLCHKDQCEQMKGALSDPLEKILSLSEDEFRDLLELSGNTYTDEEVKILYKDRKNYLPKNPSQPNCHNSQLFRDLVNDTCTAIPLVCRNL